MFRCVAKKQDFCISLWAGDGWCVGGGEGEGVIGGKGGGGG